MKISKTLVVLVFYSCSELMSQTIDTLIIFQRIDSLLKQSRYHVNQMNYDQAMADCDKAEYYVDKYFGKQSIAYGNVCFQKGRIFRFKGNYKEAEASYVLSKNIRSKLLGEYHPDYAWSLNNLGAIYMELGRLDLAEEYYLKAKKIRENALGLRHPDYSGSLNNLANLYVKMAQYEKAEKFYLESQEIRKQTSGEQSSAYASVVNNLANLYMVMGNYDKAEPFYLDAISILRKLSVKEQTELNVSLNNLAAIYWEMANYDKAESLYLEVKSIRERMLGKEHPDYASCLNNLAILYQDKGDYDKAKELFIESKALREKVLGKHHLDYAASLSSYANFHLHLNELDEAEKLFVESNKIRENILGRDHPDFATGLKNLSLVYFKKDDFLKAENYLLQAKNLFEMAFGKHHPELGSCLKSLAQLYWSLKNPNKALEYFENLFQLDKIAAIKALHHLSGEELNKFLLKNSHHQAHMLSFFQHQCEESGIQTIGTGLAYDRLLFFKGFLLNAQLHISRLTQTDSMLRAKFEKLKVIGRQLSAEYAKPLQYRKNVEALEMQFYDLEKSISRQIKDYDLAIQQVSWKEIKSQLSQQDAAIEFVKYPYFEKGKPTDKIMYAAIVLKAGSTSENQPVFVPLFEEKSLDSLIRSKAERKSDYVNTLYSQPDRGAVAAGIQNRTLYELIWKPLEQTIEGAQRVYFSSAGLLHRINLGAIPLSEEETMNDRYQLFEVPSTRQILNHEQAQIQKRNAVLMGGIQYDLDSSMMKQMQLLNQEVTIASRGGAWNFLKWTEREVNTIADILEKDGVYVSLLKSYAASEDTFKKMLSNSESPSIVHFATHGYFFQDPKEKTGSAQFTGDDVVFKKSEHSMIRSGLLLSGSNQAWLSGKPPIDGMEDGILTAYEISQLNLSNTELVVLSACETGLGDIQGNEGVYGLQRAFKIAGAKFLIMSLWQIPDQETKEFMVHFYKNWLQAKESGQDNYNKSIPEAFRKTQKEMKERFINPYQWAGFVLLM